MPTEKVHEAIERIQKYEKFLKESEYWLYRTHPTYTRANRKKAEKGIYIITRAIHELKSSSTVKIGGFTYHVHIAYRIQEMLKDLMPISMMTVFTVVDYMNQENAKHIDDEEGFTKNETDVFSQLDDMFKIQDIMAKDTMNDKSRYYIGYWLQKNPKLIELLREINEKTTNMDEEMKLFLSSFDACMKDWEYRTDITYNDSF